jgi:hypothetical protein
MKTDVAAIGAVTTITSQKKEGSNGKDRYRVFPASPRLKGDLGKKARVTFRLVPCFQGSETQTMVLESAVKPCTPRPDLKLDRLNIGLRFVRPGVFSCPCAQCVLLRLAAL